MCLSHGQIMSKVFMSELNFFLSRTIGHRFWRTLNYGGKKFFIHLYANTVSL